MLYLLQKKGSFTVSFGLFASVWFALCVFDWFCPWFSAFIGWRVGWLFFGLVSWLLWVVCCWTWWVFWVNASHVGAWYGVGQVLIWGLVNCTPDMCGWLNVCSLKFPYSDTENRTTCVFIWECWISRGWLPLKLYMHCIHFQYNTVYIWVHWLLYYVLLSWTWH